MNSGRRHIGHLSERIDRRMLQQQKSSELQRVRITATEDLTTSTASVSGRREYEEPRCVGGHSDAYVLHSQKMVAGAVSFPIMMLNTSRRLNGIAVVEVSARTTCHITLSQTRPANTIQKTFLTDDFANIIDWKSRTMICYQHRCMSAHVMCASTSIHGSSIQPP